MLSCFALPDRLLIWTITRDSTSLIERPIPRERLVRLVEDYRAALGRDRTAEGPGRHAAALHDLLLGPALAAVGPADRLVIVPDGVLHALPFATLPGGATGRPMLETHRVVIASSVSALAAARRDNGDALTRKDASALIVGNPAFDRAAFPDLPDLPGAAEDARRVASGYPRGSLLEGGRATRRAILDALARAEVFHFAGHALASVREPGASSLVVAADAPAGDPGSLTAGDLDAAHLHRLRLAVLAACGTGIGRLSSGEGALSLARPFLASGVPAVVFSLWDVEDRASVEMSVRFHEGWRRGLDPSEALRDAQLAMLRSPDPALRPAAVWGAWQIVETVQGNPAEREERP